MGMQKIAPSLRACLFKLSNNRQKMKFPKALFFSLIPIPIMPLSAQEEPGFLSQYETIEQLQNTQVAPMEDVFTDDVDVDPPFDKYTPATEEPIPQEHPLLVNLKNPVFTAGVIRTQDGGVISAPGMRIQAQQIQYTNRIENGIRIQSIEAQGDLMMEYNDRIFVGSRLEYDFINGKGTLYDGKTFVDMWFLGGEIKSSLKKMALFISLMLLLPPLKRKKTPGKSEPMM